jgi:hypothetical protein
MLKSIKLHGIGPVDNLSASFGERLNLVTGDNGLGKSFLLDVCFWSLTGTWPGGRKAIPDVTREAPTIGYEIQSKTKPASRDAKYDFKSQSWSRQRGRPPMPGLVIYAAVDGSFAVWDPARNYWRDSKGPNDNDEWPRAFLFPPSSTAENDEASKVTIRRDVANGLEEGGRVLCNGLIADWNEWYYQRTSQAANNSFKYLEDAISVLSHPLEPLTCGEPKKVFVDDSRKFPTLQMPYGTIPYPQWSAGVKRVVSFAYLIVWAWAEHLQASALRKEPSTDRIILIVDEIEAHLHPKWQRTILPAILKVVEKLQENIAVQVFAATHSPLVLASVEPHFEEAKDQLFCFNLHPDKTNTKATVCFDALPWAVHGDVVGWLTSDVFGLEQARSREAEQAIEAAESYMRGDTGQLQPGFSTKDEINDQLRKTLPSLDPFWPRWIVGAKP